LLVLCLDIRLLGVYPFSTKDLKSINMSSCISCRSVNSNDRCTSRSLIGLSFCGKHAKSKNKRIWSEVNALHPKAVLISKVWRGYTLRNRLKLAGPGVLNRHKCHNDDELVSLDPKNKLHPLDYFAFEEAGHIWWFDIRSIIGCLSSSLAPANPYTRQPLTIDTRRRIRKIFSYRLRNRLEVYHSPPQQKSAIEAENYIWMNVCQMLVENGFEDVIPNYFLRMARTQQFVFVYYLLNDLEFLCSEDPKVPKWKRCLRLIKGFRKEIMPRQSEFNISVRLGAILTLLLQETAEPYPFCFIIMSALYRL